MRRLCFNVKKEFVEEDHFLKLEKYDWGATNRLAEDYRNRFEAVKDWYEYDPDGITAMEQRAAWLDSHPHNNAHRGDLAYVLTHYNRKIGNAPEAFEQIQLLQRPESLVIVGGQQAGLFTGPLLVVYKAITIIRQAQAASARLKRPVIPVFWIAGEDHDFDEANHIHILTPDQEIAKIKLEAPSEVRTSVSRLRFEDWEDALSQLDASLLQTEFKAPLLEKIRQFGRESSTLSEYFARMMGWLFGRYGLVLLDSDDPELRKLEAPMFKSILDNRDQLTQAYMGAASGIGQAGYDALAEVSETSVNLFVFDDTGERILLQRDGERFADRKRERFFSYGQLEIWLETEPHRFSNNVLTRPLMQDYLFPVLGTVLGQAEIAYWGLTKRAFPLFGMQMPILVGRNGFTVVEGTVAKHMDKFALSFDDVVRRFDERKSSWLKEQDSLGLEDRFNEAKSRFRELYEPILEAVGSINPGMVKLGETNMQKVLEQMEFLQARATDAHQSQFDAALRQLDRIRLSLYPLVKPQERIFNVLAFLNKYGDAWLHELIGVPFENDGGHRLLYL
jgi:bacillithiol synthase